ncbi:hypothetical protein QBC47DRAFT_373944 [Echria macrotheca]|uniref:Uncharacterized protein n=1 Tax=Echria macrotheca TaxID=438768 RepID=A0AAJ0FCC7_9PEZI|nr:hypothetical protein QBC47DRAFT_373944 [Echria macrotheca]
MAGLSTADLLRVQCLSVSWFAWAVGYDSYYLARGRGKVWGRSREGLFACVCAHSHAHTHKKNVSTFFLPTCSKHNTFGCMGFRSFQQGGGSTLRTLHRRGNHVPRTKCR